VVSRTRKLDRASQAQQGSEEQVNEDELIKTRNSTPPSSVASSSSLSSFSPILSVSSLTVSSISSSPPPEDIKPLVISSPQLSSPSCSPSYLTYCGPTCEEIQGKDREYLDLFFSSYLQHTQCPLLHGASFVPEGKSLVLIRAMQACGAICAGDDDLDAKSFVAYTLSTLLSEISFQFVRFPFLSYEIPC